MLLQDNSSIFLLFLLRGASNSRFFAALNVVFGDIYWIHVDCRSTNLPQYQQLGFAKAKVVQEYTGYDTANQAAFSWKLPLYVKIRCPVLSRSLRLQRIERIDRMDSPRAWRVALVWHWIFLANRSIHLSQDQQPGGRTGTKPTKVASPDGQQICGVAPLFLSNEVGWRVFLRKKALFRRHWGLWLVESSCFHLGITCIREPKSVLPTKWLTELFLDDLSKWHFPLKWQ